MAIEKVRGGYRIIGVEGLEKTVFTSPVRFGAFSEEEFNSKGFCDLYPYRVGDERNTFDKISKILKKKSGAVLPSAYESVIYQSESGGANRTYYRTPTRTCALHFKDGGQWFVAFDDSPKIDDNPLLMDYKRPEEEIVAGRPLVMAVELYHHHFLNFILDFDNDIVRSLLSRANDSGRVVKLPLAPKRKSHITLRNNRDSSFSRDDIVRAALGEAASIYSVDIAVSSRKLLAESLEELRKERIKRKLKIDEKKLSRDNWFYCQDSISGIIQTSSFKSLERQVFEARRLFSNPAIIKPVVMIPRGVGGLEITSHDSGYFHTLSRPDLIRQGWYRRNCSTPVNPHDVIYGVINPLEWVAAEELVDPREGRGGEGGIDMEGLPWKRSKHPCDLDPFDADLAH